MSEFAKSPSRRAAFGAMAAIPALAILPVAGLGAPVERRADAGLFDLAERWLAAERRHDRIAEDLEQTDGVRAYLPRPEALAAAGFSEKQVACEEARQIAVDLRRRVAATPAKTLAGVLTKLGALTAAQGAEVIDDELELAMAQPEFDIDALFFSVARDCARLAEWGAITPAPAA